eukprot:12920743-Prorocentrum_lima.AAC.1
MYMCENPNDIEIKIRPRARKERVIQLQDATSHEAGEFKVSPTGSLTHHLTNGRRRSAADLVNRG